nr:transposon Ty3-I Gag-Pol polyprotein [Lupinus angustifolius]
MDVKSAFLNYYIQEEMFVEQPPGFEDYKHPSHVYKLKKAFYGLKQAPRAWYDRITTFLIEKGFTKGKVDTTLFIKKINHHNLLVQIYVYDIIFGSTNESLCSDIGKMMQGEFKMSMMRKLNYFLGLQIKQLDNDIFVSQSKYCRDLLKRFDRDDCKPIATPMGSSTYIDIDESGKSIEISKYLSMIGSLLYLTASRPDIMFSVCLCVRYQSKPKESHLVVFKRIMKYLKGTTKVGLWYPKGSICELVGYSDSNFVGCKYERKSTSGTCHILGNALVSWSCKKQACVALSTAQAEYIAAGSCCAQVLWLKQQLRDYGLDLGCTPLKCDNTNVINLTKNPIMHSRTKHIDIRHHFLRDHVQKKDVFVEFVDTHNQLADIFTKPLEKEPFYKIRLEFGILDEAYMS